MELKQRIIGLVVLLALAIILVPLIFDSEVALSPPNHSITLTAIKPQTSPDQSGVVNYQAPAIKPTITPTSSNTTAPPSTDSESTVASADNTVDEEEHFDDIEEPANSTDNTATELTSSQSEVATVAKTSTSQQEMLNETALKLAMARDESRQKHATIQSTGKTYFKVNPAKTTLTSTKPAKTTLAKKNSQNTATVAGAWIVQMGSFSDSSNAKKLVQTLQSKGLNAFAKNDPVKKNVHRVFIGPPQNREQADKVVAQLQQKHLSGIVVRYQQ